MRLEALLEDGGLVLGEPELLASAGAVHAVLLITTDATGAGALELRLPLPLGAGGVVPTGAAGERGGAVGRRGGPHRGTVQRRGGGGGGGVVQHVRAGVACLGDVGDDGAERGGPGRGGSGGGGGG